VQVALPPVIGKIAEVRRQRGPVTAGPGQPDAWHAGVVLTGVFADLISGDHTVIKARSGEPQKAEYTNETPATQPSGDLPQPEGRPWCRWTDRADREGGMTRNGYHSDLPNVTMVVSCPPSLTPVTVPDTLWPVNLMMPGVCRLAVLSESIV
jgi:hypothetical protein